MVSSTSESVTSPKEMRRVAGASAVGTGIELYDFLIFGLAAGLVFPRLFFPESDPLVGTLLSFMTFGAGFLSRPLGGLAFGHFGDRVSRKTMLVIALLATGACTVAMGLLPTYATVGVLAPILLVTLRILQGFFMGGEQSGAFLMVTEHAPGGRKAFWGAFVTAGSPIGSLLGIGAFQITAAATGPAFVEWGWRIPFLASAVLIAIGIYIRLGISESPVFEKIQPDEIRRVPIAGVFATALPFVVGGILVNLGFNLFIFIINSFSVAYGTTQLGMQRTDILLSGLWGSLGMLVAVFVAGWLADRYGLIKIMAIGAIFQMFWAFPYFWLFDTKNLGLLYLAVVVAYIGLSFVFGPMAAFYVTLFKPEYRYSGVALSYNLGAVLGGGLSPSIATALLGSFEGSTGISVYIAIGGALSLIGLLITAKHVNSVSRRSAP
ncbi:MFS transporter [Naumannella halotolerans]|uniref:Sugar phosphate permease n=1 Tax=Naumannella halotolerans TaxID=993414 RepID=A0A4R7J1J3_9ACTN|nr:MFS transporter [Naumannella halotolerans]TDT31022.1 sugar phosphate permease [Naumannella halotolerans]